MAEWGGEQGVTNKTVSSVIDDINEWENPRGGFVYYVTAMFSDESVGSVGKLTEADARTVQAQLRDAIGEELDFTVEDGGTSQGGRQKWKIKGFGPPGGAATYTAPGVQGGGQGSTLPGTGSASRGRSPEHDQFIQERMDRRTALMQAVELLRPVQEKHESGEVTASLGMAVADWMYEWLRQTSEPASSAYHDASVDSPRTTQAGAGSGTTSPAVGANASKGAETPAGDPTSAGDVSSSLSAPAEGGGQSESALGKDAEDCPPHDLDLDVAPKAMRYPCRRCKAWINPTRPSQLANKEPITE